MPENKEKTLDQKQDEIPDFKNFKQNPRYQELEKKKSKKGFTSVFLAIFIIFLVAFSSLTVFILVYPQSRISRTIVNNTYLKNLINLDQNSEESRPINDLIGSEPVINNLEFTQSRNSLTVADVVKKSLPSVLSISLRSKSLEENKLSPDLTAGTGFIVDESGLVISNKHVISMVCNQGIDNLDIVGLDKEGQILELEILSIDPVEDIAILKIKNPENKIFTPVEIFDSENLTLGQEVIAVGNVLGQLQNTVTRGIVSGLNRTFKTSLTDQCTGKRFEADNLIQTDAAINKGNSGGPLFNSSGQLIGVNTLASNEAQNLGLAIPSSSIKNVINSFLENGKITRSTTSLKTVSINPLLQGQNGWIPTSYGEIIYTLEPDQNAVQENSPESIAGLSEGDIILEMNEEKLIYSYSNPSPFKRAILNQPAGEEITLKVLKAKNSNKDSFEYENSTKEIKLILNSVSFNLEKSKIETIDYSKQNQDFKDKKEVKES
jgi:serine protease Do